MQNSSTVVVNPLLTGLAIGAAAKLDLVCAKPGICTPTNGNKTGTVFVRGLGDYMGSVEEKFSAWNDDYPMMDTVDPTTVTFELKPWQRAGFVSDRDETFSQLPGSLVKDTAAILGRRGAIFMERQLAAAVFSTTNFANAPISGGGALTGGAGVQWSSFTTAKPDQDLKAAKIRYREQSNLDSPPDLIIGQQVLDAYCNCLQAQGVAVATSGAAQAEQLTEEYAIARIKRLHGFANVYVGSARYNTAAPGLAVSGDYIWGKHFWIGHLSGPVGTTLASGIAVTPRAIACFAHTQGGAGLNLDGVSLPILVGQTQQVPPKARGTVISAEALFDVKLLSASFGYHVTSVVA